MASVVCSWYGLGGYSYYLAPRHHLDFEPYPAKRRKVETTIDENSEFTCIELSGRSEVSYKPHADLPRSTSSSYRHRHYLHTQQPLSHLPQERVLQQESEECEVLEEGTTIRNIYPEVLAIIFSYLDIRAKGRAAQVCSSWRDACYNKSVWKGVEAKLHLRRSNPTLFSSLVKRGIKKVQVLSLRRSLREVVQGIPNLESLNLSGCYSLTDVAMEHALCRDIPTLKTLDLSLCKHITDSSLGRIAQHCEHLETLELGGCTNISNTGLLLVAWGLKKLRSLNLRSCWQVSDGGIAHLAGMSAQAGTGAPSLERLGLQDCQKLSDESLKFISEGLVKLKEMNLSFCISITDSGLKPLSRMSSLAELNLRSCDNVSDIGVGYLAEGCQNLSSLDVSFCERVADHALVHVAQGLVRLSSLSLSACQISDEGIAKIASSLKKLETLNIGQCTKITDSSLEHIGRQLTNLKSIDLYGCTKLSKHGLDKFTQSPQLKHLNLGLWHSR